MKGKGICELSLEYPIQLFSLNLYGIAGCFSISSHLNILAIMDIKYNHSHESKCLSQAQSIMGNKMPDPTSATRPIISPSSNLTREVNEEVIVIVSASFMIVRNTIEVLWLLRDATDEFNSKFLDATEGAFH